MTTFFFESFTWMTAFVAYQMTSENPFNIKDILAVQTTAVMSMGAMAFQNLAVSVGLAGPVLAVIGLTGIF